MLKQGWLPAFNVTQNVEGWDARAINVSANKYSFSGSTTLIGYGTAHNNSSPGNTYYNLPIKFEVFNPNGVLIHEESGTISNLSSGQSIDYQTNNIIISSSDPDGNYQIRFTVFPQLDSNPANNSGSVYVYKGPSGSIDQYHIESNYALMTMNGSVQLSVSFFLFYHHNKGISY